MAKKVKRKNSKPLHVMTTLDRFRTWQHRARTSGMSLREWVTRTLDSGPILQVIVTPAD